MLINKNVVLNAMYRKNIKTQAELSERMDLDRSTLSNMLNGSYNPIKSNVLKLMDELDISFEEIVSEKDVGLIKEDTMQQISLFSESSIGINRFDYKNESFSDTSQVRPIRDFSVLETFAGAGGLALGFEKAGVINAGVIELDADAVSTLRNNRPEWNILEGDINQITEQGILTYEEFSPLKDLDILTGGFPCQSFSYAGKGKGFADTRGTLFYPYAMLIEQLMPKVFVAENVKGLVNHDKGKTLTTMISTFKDIGYQINWNVLNAWDYETAQKRERIFIIGIRNDLVNLQKYSYSFPASFDYKPVLKDVLKNVPTSEGIKYSDKKKKVLELVPPGGCWVDLPEEIAKDYLGASWNSGGGKRGMARRISWDEPSLTLTTSPNQKQTERCHPDETRPFSVREYARIQGFPDDWKFSGNVYSQYKQIGNAVPVELAKNVGKSIINYLNQFQ